MSASAVTQAQPLAPLEGARLVEELRHQFGTGKTRPLAWRLAQLDGLKRLMQECEEEILGALKSDLGKPTLEAFGMEIGATLAELDHARKRVRGWMKPERRSTSLVALPGTSKVHSDPLGVVLIIAPWNYPFGLTLTPLIGALAAGNCVIVKPSEVSAETSKVIAKLLPRYVDRDCVKVVEGGVRETTDLLEQRFDHILYTGNGRVGRIVMAAAAKHLTPVTLELGGKSPCIVDREVDLDVAAKRIAWAKWVNCGQTCIAPDYVLAHREIHDALIEKIAAAAREFYGEEPRHSKDYARIINEHHLRRLVALLGSGDIVIGGQSDEGERYLAPTILKNVDPESLVMQDEIFGPILPVLKIEDVEEAIRFVNGRDKPLALYLFSSSGKLQREIVERTSSGGVCLNHAIYHVGIPSMPFGGVGESGMGAYHGKAGFDTFSHKKAVLSKPTFIDPPVAYPPFTPGKEALFRRVF